MEKFHGKLVGIVRWDQLDEFWEVMQAIQTDDWFVYHIGEQPPLTTCSSDKLHHFIEEINALIRKEHQERYCGIVYTDSKDEPSFIKIYDPNNLGHVCGSSGNTPPPLPGWILSKIQPIDLQAAMPPPGGRKRWWQAIFG